MNRKVFFGGDILTLGEAPSPEAVLVEDGRIAALGSRRDFSDAEPVNLRGGTLMPSFLDAHSHITALSGTLGLVNLQGAAGFEEILDRLADFRTRKNIAPGEWISGFGYDHNSLREKKHPTAELLDRLGPENPILISHASGHMGVMNSAALRSVGISADTPNPAGGVIGREDDGRTPNGYLEETAFTVLAAGAVPKPGLEERCRLMEEALDVYLSHGITTIQDGLTRASEWELLKAMSDRGRFLADVVCYADLRENGDMAKNNPDFQKKYKNRLKIGGYKIFLDGSPQGRTAWMTKPYEGAKDGYRGYPVYQDKEVLEFVQTALRDGMQLLVHCNGDAAAEQMIEAFQTARGRLPEAPEIRPVMIHAQLVREDQLQRMARLNMIASFFTAHTWYWGDVHFDNFGPERASRISPAASAQKAGVVFTFHQDSPVIPPDMLETVWCAVNRVTRSGRHIGPGEKISVLDALRAVTRNAAYQYFEEEEKGELRPGMLADLVLLDHNPLTVPPDSLRELRVLETLKEGVSVYRRK